MKRRSDWCSMIEPIRSCSHISGKWHASDGNTDSHVRLLSCATFNTAFVLWQKEHHAKRFGAIHVGFKTFWFTLRPQRCEFSRKYWSGFENCEMTGRKLFEFFSSTYRTNWLWTYHFCPLALFLPASHVETFWWTHNKLIDILWRHAHHQQQDEYPLPRTYTRTRFACKSTCEKSTIRIIFLIQIWMRANVLEAQMLDERRLKWFGYCRKSYFRIRRTCVFVYRCTQWTIP